MPDSGAAQPPRRSRFDETGDEAEDDAFGSYPDYSEYQHSRSRDRTKPPSSEPSSPAAD